MTLQAWADDVVDATAELRAQSGVQRVAIVGLRLGANVAARAAQSLTGRDQVQQLLMWDPIVDGAAYLRELAAGHAEYMSEEFGTEQPPPRTDERGFPEEALGHPLPRALRDGIASLGRDAQDELRAERVTVVMTRDLPAADRLQQRVKAHPRGEWIAMTSSVPWNSDAAVNSAVVPMDVVDQLVARIAS